MSALKLAALALSFGFLTACGNTATQPKKSGEEGKEKTENSSPSEVDKPEDNKSNTEATTTTPTDAKPNAKTGTENKKDEKLSGQIVGNDSDEHGCKASAGYSWSEVKGECVRLWETGTALSATTNEYKGFAAYVIMNSDNSKAEVFVPGTQGGVMLSKKGSGWESGDWKLSKTNSKLTLKKGTTTLFEQD